MDIRVVETGNGGDLVKNTNDLEVISGFESMIYMALFGGNVEASTPSRRLENEQDFSWWGNNLFFPNDTSVQFNSITERRLREVALDSAGRIRIEDGIRQDLQFMSPFAIVKVDTIIISLDRIAIGIQVTERSNLEQKEFVYIWDATKSELFDKDFTPAGVASSGGFDYDFDFDFE